MRCAPNPRGWAKFLLEKRMPCCWREGWFSKMRNLNQNGRERTITNLLRRKRNRRRICNHMGKPKFTAPAAMVELFGVGPCSPTILQTMGRHECLIVRCYCAGDQPEQNIIRIGDMQDNCFSLRAICIKLQPVAL